MSASENPSEARIEMDTVSAWSRKSCPATPSTKTIGKKTATVVNVEATTGAATSTVPEIAASRAPAPWPRRRWIASSTTIESSSSIPTPSASPPSDMMFSESPICCITKKVPITETGIASATTAVAPRSRRKSPITRIASRPPCQAFATTSEIASSMNRDWSNRVASAIPAGTESPISSSRFRIPSATKTVFASPSLKIRTSTPSASFSRRITSWSRKPAWTSATSATRTRRPSFSRTITAPIRSGVSSSLSVRTR